MFYSFLKITILTTFRLFLPTDSREEPIFLTWLALFSFPLLLISQKKAKFHFLTPPSLSELNNLLKTIAQRIIKLLEKQGLIIKDEGVENKFLDLKANEPMDHIHSSSITYRIALGK